VIGLAGLLMTMSMGSRTETLTIYGPPGIRGYVDLSRKYLKFGVAYPLEIREIEGGPVIEEEDYRIDALPVDHRVFTLAYRLKEYPRPGRFDLAAAERLGVPPGPLYKQLQLGKEVALDGGRVVKPEEILGPPRPGRTVVYMVDTRPFAAAEDFVRGADLLIHDGMFADDLADESGLKGHSTAREAARLASRAGVARLVLVHISPRYLSIREMLKEAREDFPATRVARDLDVYEIEYREDPVASRA
jgi:ribonuclease Z